MLKNDKEIIAVIATGRPFQSFAIGSQLKKKFPNIKWIPDYRDEWTSHSRNESNTLLQSFILTSEKKSEQKWTKNADVFLTVSEVVKNNLQHHIKKTGKIVLNGFDNEIPKNQITHSKSLNGEFHIMYTGTVYQDQDFIPVLNVIEKIQEEKQMTISLHFIGVGIQEDIVRDLKNKFNISIEIIQRLSDKKLKEYTSKADMFLLTSYYDTPGIYPVKIFEYYNSKKTVLLCPSDNNVMEEFILKSNCGFVANTEKECEKILLNLIEQKKEGNTIKLERNIEYGNQFSRKNQTKHLAEILNNL